MPMTVSLRPDAGGPAKGPGRRASTAMSFVAHAAVLLALVAVAPDPAPPRPEPPSIRVALVELRPRLDPTPAETLSPAEPEPPKVEEKPVEEEKPSEAKPRPEAPRPSPIKAPPRNLVAKATVSKPTPDAVAVGGGSTGQGMAEVGDGDLAGATTAGDGGGGACNMTRRLQDALRRDRRAQAAVAEVNRGKAILVWNGEWVRHPAQEGAGLAAVREAIMWEVGFAPEECRTQAMNGLVLISLNDGSRVALGQGRWRWSDLLFAKGIRPSGA